VIGEYNRLIWVFGHNASASSNRRGSRLLGLQPTANISILTKLAPHRELRSLTLYIIVPVGIKQANTHRVLRDALEFFDEVLRVNGKSKLENLEVKAIKYMDGWFGYDTQDVVTAKITRYGRLSRDSDRAWIQSTLDIKVQTIAMKLFHLVPVQRAILRLQSKPNECRKGF
jgi:hypothetical protein